LTYKQDRIIIEGILSDNATIRNSALKTVYDAFFKKIEAYVTKNSGNSADVKDVFQEGIMILYQNIINERFRAESSLKTYFISICRNVWLQKLKHKKMWINKDADIEKADPDLEKEFINVDTMRKAIGKLKDDCEKILIGFYYEAKSMNELAATFNLGSEQAAKNKKSRCLKYLVKLLEKKGLAYDDFLL